MPHAAPALDLQALLVDDLGSLVDDLDHVERLQRYRADAWAWIAECVSTVDEMDARTPIKPFPVAVCVACGVYVGHAQRAACPQCGRPPAPLAYLETIARQWQSGTPSILLVPKARRMKLTWLAISLQVWLAWTRPHANIFVVSDKLEKSAELIERARGIIARLPAAAGGPLPVTTRVAPPEIRFPNESWMVGIAEGAGQLRQFTATSIVADEFAHWQAPRESYTAFLPCIEGGGRVLIVSSAAPGFFKELVEGSAF
jgi:hypothetical protein